MLCHPPLLRLFLSNALVTFTLQPLPDKRNWDEAYKRYSNTKLSLITCVLTLRWIKQPFSTSDQYTVQLLPVIKLAFLVVDSYITSISLSLTNISVVLQFLPHFAIKILILCTLHLLLDIWASKNLIPYSPSFLLA